MKYVQKLAMFLKAFAGVSLIGMMLLTCADVVGTVLGHPVLGSEEITAMWASILLAFSLPAAHLEKAHVGVDLLYLKLPPLGKKINDIFVDLLSLGLFSLTARECYKYGIEMHASGQVSMTLRLPSYLLLYAISFAIFILSIVILVELITLFRPGASTSGETKCQIQ